MLSAIDVGVLATLVLFILPFLAGAAIFALLLGMLVPRLLLDEKIQSALEFRLTSHHASWQLDEKIVPWPGRQLEWAAVAAMLTILLAVESVTHDPRLSETWLSAGIASAILAFAMPFFLYRFSRRAVLRLVRGEIVARLNALSREENIFLRKLSSVGGRIETLYAEANLGTSIQITEISKSILVERASGKIPTAKPRLDRAIRTLRMFADQVGDYLEAYRQVNLDFEFTKNMVIDRGSVTLLDELDRLKGDLRSQEIGYFFDGAQWDKLQDRIGQIAFDLKMIRNMVEGGSALPMSLGQACQTLNVTTDTSMKSAKAVVDALRRVWHPDIATDEERERRTAKITQINVAWEIFVAACEGAENELAKPERRLELA